MSGFLFFEHVPAHEREVTLHADLLDARTGRQLGRLTAPLVVANAKAD